MDRIMGRQQEVGKVFEVGEEFRISCNHLVNSAGLINLVDMRKAPFNNIKFWLPKANNIKAQSQTLKVTFRDATGNHHLYAFNFNS